MEKATKSTRRKYIIAGITGLSLFIIQTGCYALALALNKTWAAHDLTIDAIDGLFPFLPIFSVIYVLSFPFWVLVPVLAVRAGNERFCNYIAAALISYVIGFAVFLVFPTTIARPQVTGSSPFDLLTELVYSMDSPGAARNLMPSFHCLNSWLCFMCVRRQKSVPLAFRLFVLIFASLICLSTMFIKQHYIMDFITAVLLGESAFLLSSKLKLGRPLYCILPPEK